MVQQLKSALSVFLIAILLIAVVGVPFSYHDCSLRGQHKFQSGFFFNNSNTHCDCCTKADSGDVACEHPHEGESCPSSQHVDRNTYNTEDTSFTHAACCKIKAFLLELSVIAQQIFDAAREVISSITLVLKEVIHQCIKFINEFILLKEQYYPPDIPITSQSGTILFSQFLL